jgi:IstB-like ATP binding protein
MTGAVESTLTDAAAKNLGVSATLEWLADMELEARKQRAIERRSRCSRIQAQPASIPSPSQDPPAGQIAHLAPARSGLPDDGHQSRAHRQSRRRHKTYLARIFGWRACQANHRVLFTTAMDMLNHLLASQVDHSLVGRLEAYTEPILLIVDDLGYPGAQATDLESVLPGNLDPPQP